MSDDENSAIQPVPEMPPAEFRSRIPDQPSFLRENFSAIIWAIVLVLLAILVGQNWNDTKINLLFWSVTLKLSWALIGAAIFGIILGWLVPIFWHMRRRKRQQLG